MDFLKKVKWTPLTILKTLGLVLLAIIVLSVALRLMAPTLGALLHSPGGFGFSASQTTDSIGFYGADDFAEEAIYNERGNVKLSLTNIGIPAPQPGGSIGGDAEDFEVTEYSASIETRNREHACSEVSSLKGLDYVVFEQSNEYDHGCNFTFKVEHDRVEEVLAVIESLDPKNLSENTYTIKRQLDDFTSETEILEKKLASIDETLENAITAYDEIALLATQTRDAESLARIIDSKISLIERLTVERIETNAHLERLARGKAEQLDRLTYTYFSVHVFENKLVDGDGLRDSWKAAVKNFVRNVNGIAQDLTVNLASLILLLIQYVLYFLIILVVVKYLWKATRYIWKK